MNLDKVLIANRGEIAVRIIRTCHRLGLRTVAVYSDADRNAPYVALANEACYIGASEAKVSYLNGARLIEAAKRAGADAIHPGYGFLAENAQFARRCERAGLTFIGPRAAVIEQMGSKINAKAVAEAAGVPVVPGYNGADQSFARLRGEAERLETPLLIKASAGGGGRGMRRVLDLAEFDQALRAAQQEAQAAFGSPAILLERLIANARHIEVQILADQHGQVLHLFERDCSIQRHHHKIIEETPAPHLPAQTRRDLLNDAVNLAQAIAYDNVGTVEFLVDSTLGDYYFMEMNTRLQVEHPVTEAITGLDLVEWQLRVAAGDKLPFEQEEIRCTGWALEARVAAENPAEGFRPETGTITVYHEPQASGLRIDSGVELGSQIGPYYDSMLAKVIATGSTRQVALRRLRRGLGNFRLGGVGTNLSFLLNLLQLDDFAHGLHHTGTLSLAYPDGWQASPLSSTQIAQAALAMLLHEQQTRPASSVPATPWGTLGNWRVTEAAGGLGASLYYSRDAEGTLVEVTVKGRGAHYEVQIAGERLLVAENAVLSASRLSYEEAAFRQAQGASYRHSIGVDIHQRRVTLYGDDARPQIDLLLAEEALLIGREPEQSDDKHVIRAPMPGLIVELLAAVGDKVVAGQTIVVLEAMKLLQHLTAPISGTVAAVRYQKGDSVDGGAVLILID